MRFPIPRQLPAFSLPCASWRPALPPTGNNFPKNFPSSGFSPASSPIERFYTSHQFFRLAAAGKARYPARLVTSLSISLPNLSCLFPRRPRTSMPTELRNFLALSYEELEDLNLKAKEQRRTRVAIDKIQEERLRYLTDEHRIKAVTVMFSDLEGRLHMLDYDKKFLLKSWDNLTFDGSSIRGFTAQRESDLRLGLDWSSFYWAPSDVFGSGKVLVFGDVIDKGGTPYSADIRGNLKVFAEEMHKKEGYTLNAANEIEGFLFQGADAERRYHETNKFEYVNTGGYYHSLPGDPLRTFIDTTAEVQRAMGFQNEKDHPEVAPSQFEINYGYGEVVAAA